MQRQGLGKIPGLSRGKEGWRAQCNRGGPRQTFSHLPPFHMQIVKKRNIEFYRDHEAPRIWRRAPPGSTTLWPARVRLANLTWNKGEGEARRVGARGLRRQAHLDSAGRGGAGSRARRPRTGSFRRQLAVLPSGEPLRSSSWDPGTEQSWGETGQSAGTRGRWECGMPRESAFVCEAREQGAPTPFPK